MTLERDGFNLRRALVVTGAAGAIIAAAGHGPAWHASAAASTITFANQVVPGLASATDLGAVDPNQPVEVAVSLQKDLAAIYRAEAALYDPASPSYHQFLTPAQWNARFGAPPQQLASARAFATSQGMSLGNPEVLRDYVVVTGTAAQADRTFGVSLHNFRDSTGNTFYATSTGATVPAGLGIDSVLGLDNAHPLHTHLAKGAAASAGQPQCIGTACTGILQAQDLWSAYNMPADNFGEGQTVGIIGEGQTADVIAALREFEKTRNLPQVPVQVYHVDPADGPTVVESTRDDSGRVEWELDTQASTGMAPHVKQVRLYFGTSLQLTQLTLALKTWANDPEGPLQVSASLGACEDDPGLDPLLGAAQRNSMVATAQAAMEGRTLFASTGDTGAGCALAVAVNGVNYGPIPTDEYPSIDPNAVGVGGTILYTDGAAQPKRVLERAWDHTGGGPSRFIAQPSYQTGASPLLAANACISQPDGTPYPPGQLCRGVSDVAALSGDATISADHRLPHGTVSANGYDMVDNAAGVMNDHFSEGGTSLSSPLWLGIWARVQAHHDAGNSATSSLGFANPAIYKLAQGAATAHDFFDVTVGGNPLPAGPGWDYPTGWGAPDVTNLTKDASGDATTAAVSNVQPSGPDPAPIYGTTIGQPSCNFAVYDSSSDAPDGFTLKQDDQLDIVEGDFGLTPDGKSLRVVLTIKNLSKTIPSGSNFLEYNTYWSFTPPGGQATNYAVDVQVDSSGNVTYADGTETVTTTQGTTNYQFNANAAGHATGLFGSGANGQVEVDAPLADIGAPATGDKLTAPTAFTSAGLSPPAVVGGFGFIADLDGPGNPYTLGAATCLTQGPGSNVPEAPLSVLLPLLGGGALLVALESRRRRRRAASTG